MKKNWNWRFVLEKNKPHQFFRVTKLTFFLCLCVMTSLEASVTAQQRLTMKLGKAGIREIFNEIQKQTSKTVIYNDDRLQLDQKIKADFKDIRLEELLDRILTERGMGYKLVDDYIVIIPKEEQAVPQVVQERIIKGIVVDNKGGILPGVTVLIKGTQVGTATDVDGKFTLKIPDSKDLVLVFTFVGMKSKEVKPGTQNELKVQLEYNEESLEEVVVTGIFERKAESFTGSSVSMKAEDLKRVGNQNVFQSLRSLDPSLMIFDNMEFGSDPNKNPKMTLRGASSLDLAAAGEEIDIKGTYANDPNAPLFILDGFEASVQKIMDLDMDRVASLTILKDASAKAIYGSRAANGVIVIETKRSTTGNLRVTYTVMSISRLPTSVRTT